MQRNSRNPILTRLDIPPINRQLVDVSSVFNPGAIRFRNETLLLLRVQGRSRETFLLTATSADGVGFSIRSEVVELPGLDRLGRQVFHVYDPRITALDGRYYVAAAIDTDRGCRVGLWRTDDFRSFEFVCLPFDLDTRNAVLFPEKIGGRYAMLHRPNRAQLDGAVASGCSIELATSDDLVTWRSETEVVQGRFHYWDELVGSGPPPIKTRRGWLHIYHGIATHFAASNIYQAGAVLLDLDRPERVIARTRCNILEPRELYEMVGQVPNVVFPSGLVPAKTGADGLVDDDTLLYVYYGAADTSIGLATTTARELLEACDEV